MTSDLVEEVSSGKSVLIDVRTLIEWNQGHAKGATLFPLSKIQNGELPNLHKEKTIYLYCRSGNRSGIATAILEKAGFTKVKNLGGLVDWQRIGGEIEK